MEPEHPRPSRPHHHPHLLNLLPVTSVSSPSSPQPGYRTASGVTPASSPGVFSPQQHSHSSPHVPTMASVASATSASAALAAAAGTSSASATVSPLPDSTLSTPPGGISHEHSYVATRQPVRETHIANVDRDFTTGRKTINEYQVLEEIGRGQHGKVKLAQDNRDGRMVAIKIIPRLSKTRRLGKVSAVDPQQNTKREIAILKKIRHENIVALLEVIDDPELQKIYMVLEYVERGEMTWRKKGLPNICYFERYRFEQGVHGKPLAPGECNWHAVLERKATIRALKEARANGTPPPVNEWTTKYHVTADDEDGQPPWWYVPSIGLGPDASLLESHPISRATSRAPSRVASSASVASAPTPHSYSSDASPLSYMAQDGGDPHNFILGDDDDDGFGGDGGSQTPGLLHPGNAMSNALDGSMFGAYMDDNARQRHRSPSIADSIMSHLSGLDFNSMVHDPYADDFSYVPCFNIHQARTAFRDTVLGLEYLHYHGVVHRDIKPANLLWSKGFHVKISDFGVSYFGRPIRDGEPDVTVSEAEARNFDDDRELSKTVGTPAFFAPELCYTDIDKEPPRVSEQIDVWSLGVTLYCLLYARIPFLAEDEFSMFRKIATEEAFIPKSRLKPVGIYTDPTGSSLYSRTNVHPQYRSDADPEYEEISDPLLDLLRKMLIKNPEKRIRLKDIKRHPWVTEDITNIPAWLSETDPARDQDRTIHVDDAEIGDAVVPLNFLQRARSAVKRAVDKVMHPQRDESANASSTRVRAASSAASSSRVIAEQAAGANTSQPINILPATLQHHNSTPGIGTGGSHGNQNGHGFGFGSHGHSNSHGHMHSYSQGHQPTSSSPLSFHHYHTTNNPRDARRKSLHKTDSADYFATVTQMPTAPVPSAGIGAGFPGHTEPHHPLAQSQTASPYASPGEKTPNSESQQQLTDASAAALAVAQAQPVMPALSTATTSTTVYNYNIDGSGEASPATPPSRPMTRHVHSRSITNAILSRASIMREIQTMPPTPAAVPADTNATRRTREVRSSSSTDASFNARTRSVDRAGIVFANPDKRASPVVGLSTANVPGSVQQPSLHMSTSTVGSDETETQTQVLTNPLQLTERPATAHRVQDIIAKDTSTIVGRNKSNSLSALPNTTVDASKLSVANAAPESIPCPPSPRQAIETTAAAPVPATANSSSSVSLEGGYDQTPLTSPSEVTHHSFVNSGSVGSSTGGNSHQGHRKGSSNAMMTMAFQSDPSLPALLSGASSVSNDMEGDFLGNPGVVSSGPSVDVSDSLTPPALLGKEPAAFPLVGLKDQQGWGSGGAIPVEIDNTIATAGAAATGRSTSTSSRTPLATPVRGNSRCFTDEDDDSDSDGGIIMMAKAKKKVATFAPPTTGTPGSAGRTTHMARRRDTSTSIGSTDTAKKVGLSTTTPANGDN